MINGFNINYHGQIMVIINYKNNSRSDNKISLPGYQNVYAHNTVNIAAMVK